VGRARSENNGWATPVIHLSCLQGAGLLACAA
jgi:hypothetical protein